VRAAALPMPSLLLMQAGILHSPEKATSFTLKVEAVMTMSASPPAPINVYQIPRTAGPTVHVVLGKSVNAPRVSSRKDVELLGMILANSQASLEGRGMSYVRREGIELVRECKLSSALQPLIISLHTDTSNVKVPTSLNPETPVTSTVYSVLATPAHDKKLPLPMPSLLKRQLGRAHVPVKTTSLLLNVAEVIDSSKIVA